MIALIFDSNTAAVAFHPHINGLLHTHFIDHYGRGNNVVCENKIILHNRRCIGDTVLGEATILKLYLKIKTKQFQLSIRSRFYPQDFHQARLEPHRWGVSCLQKIKVDIYRKKTNQKKTHHMMRKRKGETKKKLKPCAPGHWTAVAVQKPLQPSSIL